MTNDYRQEQFAERLRRIEEQRTGAPTTPGQDARPQPSSNYGYGVEQEDHRIRNGIIWAFIFAALGTGGYYGWKALPQDMVDALAGMASTSESTMQTAGVASISAGSPPTRETALMSDQGPTLASPLVANQSPEPLELAAITDTADLPTGDTPIGQLIGFDRNAMCDLRQPLPTEKVMNLRIQTALITAPVQAFSQEQLANRLIDNIENVTQDGRAYDATAQVTGQKTAMDVFVTDSSAPIYLVLQNLGPGVIWNIHTAPDVTIAHVAIVSSGYSGLVAPPNDASFEALLVSDFVSRHEFGADDVVRECMIRPWRKPQADWIASIKAADGNMLYENQVHTYQKGYDAYNAWFTQTLGVDASTHLVTARDAAHALLGPVPAEPIAYQSMAGQDVYVMRTDHMFTGDTATRQSTTDDLHDSLLLAAIGGGIDALNPDPMVEVSQ
ncbi:hypothetical protein [Loktanella sp. Alg231-35]|uniref:hypothetical protein n=1 Tax=Loktanella sp. Alg231-35 TaxID=1922220 RepID=UPI000D54EADB|nr:hypothetical protein [Loktanella sp. Alg231-35]